MQDERAGSLRAGRRPADAFVEKCPRVSTVEGTNACGAYDLRRHHARVDGHAVEGRIGRRPVRGAAAGVAAPHGEGAVALAVAIEPVFRMGDADFSRLVVRPVAADPAADRAVAVRQRIRRSGLDADGAAVADGGDDNDGTVVPLCGPGEGTRGARLPRFLGARGVHNGAMRRFLFVFIAGLGCALPSFPALAADAAPEAATEDIPYWMIGRFIGRNDSYGGRYVELVIYANGRAVGIVDGQVVLEGLAKGERIYIEDAVLIVTRTDAGLTTTEIGNETNVVIYERM